MAGLEPLLLAHVFLFWHQYPESARAVIPPAVIDALRARLDESSDAGESDACASLLDPRVIEETLADQSLHGRS
jgi:hypothetical protein